MNALELNERAIGVANFMAGQAGPMRAEVIEMECGARVIDCGVSATGGLETGLALSHVCMSDLAKIQMLHSEFAGRKMPHIQVSTDHPFAACLLSQYAGWQVTGDDYFGMGSGPMRLAACREEMLKEFGFEPEVPPHAVGVLEAGKLPTEDVCGDLMTKCGCGVTLLVAPTASQAGNVQIVARSVETAMHKLHEVGFDPRLVASGLGSAPLPAVAKDDLTGIGRTNDAILYGATVTLWVDCEDAEIEETGPKVPSNSSSAHGRSFAELFKEAKGDFYAIDKHLFSPAVVEFQNLRTGNVFRFGEIVEELVIL
ncbi:MAG: methenyltetrahydromethanopterin cyclohydrolase [Planctomycetaceae bacterium]